jgi:hypothetical protein
MVVVLVEVADGNHYSLGVEGSWGWAVEHYSCLDMDMSVEAEVACSMEH